MKLKIDRAPARTLLSGRFRSEHLDRVKAEIELCESPAVLDLEELELIDVEAVRFLNASEEKRCLGVALFALIMQPRPGVQR